jgi:hypothetical protein
MADSRIDGFGEPPRYAYRCNGSCKLLLDRPGYCERVTCMRFAYPFQEISEITFKCAAAGCQEKNTSIPRICHDVPAKALHVISKEEMFSVYDASQLPARVPANDCGRHLQYVPSGVTPVKVQPISLAKWHGREFKFTNVSFTKPNEQPISTNSIMVHPGEILHFSFDCESDWKKSPSDYCPGCIVQWYAGMEGPEGGNIFKVNLFQLNSGDYCHEIQIRNVQIISPSVPGIYYICGTISLEYDYVQHVQFSNETGWHFAVVQVIPKTAH